MGPHGTYSTYVNHKCRCDACRQANTEAVRRMRAARVARRDQVIVTLPHGSPSSYVNWGCRCDDCRRGVREADRRRREAKS